MIVCSVLSRHVVANRYLLFFTPTARELFYTRNTTHVSVIGKRFTSFHVPGNDLFVVPVALSTVETVVLLSDCQETDHLFVRLFPFGNIRENRRSVRFFDDKGKGRCHRSCSNKFTTHTKQPSLTPSITGPRYFGCALCCALKLRSSVHLEFRTYGRWSFSAKRLSFRGIFCC